MKILLFDIDGTLLKCGGAGKASLIKACTEVYGSAGAMETIDFQGKTDNYILRESLKSEGIDEAMINRSLEQLKERYISHLREALTPDVGEALPGVTTLLDRLRGTSEVLLGLLTGNFAKGAEVKLERFGMAHYFSFGIFGDSVYDRNDMPPLARGIVREKFGVDPRYQDMIIVGDTVHDIACAKTVNAVSVSVGTGWTVKEALLEKDPDYYFDDLSDHQAFISTLL